MKPYLLVTGDFVTTGGMDRANYALASYLARKGHETHLVAHRVAEDLLRLPNVRFHRVPKLGGSYFLSTPLLNRAGRYWAKRVGGHVLVNGGNCLAGEVCWVHYLHAAWPTQAAGSLPRRLKAALSHRLFRSMEAKALGRARLVLTNSERTKRDVIEHYRLSGERVHVVYYGIDAERFRPASAAEKREARAKLDWPPDVPHAAFLGALGDRRKGFDTLFDAWRMLCKDAQWDARLVVIGTGAELPRWQTRAAEAGLSERVLFLGFRPDVPEVLTACDALVAPTRYEAYGLGVHEALCCGLPALVSASAGVAERYPPELHELLIDDPDDPVGLAERLRAWRTRAERMREVVLNWSEQLRRYTWDDMARRIVEVVEAGGPV